MNQKRFLCFSKRKDFTDRIQCHVINSSQETLRIFQNRLTLSSNFEIPYFVEILPENISIVSFSQKKVILMVFGYRKILQES